jgi:hypothetical protein
VGGLGARGEWGKELPPGTHCSAARPTPERQSAPRRVPHREVSGGNGQAESWESCFVAAHWSQLTSLANFMYARLMSREDEPFSTPKVWYNFSVSACEERGG